MRSATWLADQLPATMTERPAKVAGVPAVLAGPNDFFVRFLEIFQTVADTVLEQIDALPDVFDPDVAPDRIVQLMSTWLGIDWMDETLDLDTKRRIVQSYASLIPMRGTASGLCQLLELLGGSDVKVSDNAIVRRNSFATTARPSRDRPAPHVVVSMSEVRWLGTRPHLADAIPDDQERHRRERDLVRIVRDEVPATASFELTIGTTTLWPPPPAASNPVEEQP